MVNDTLPNPPKLGKRKGNIRLERKGKKKEGKIHTLNERWNHGDPS